MTTPFDNKFKPGDPIPADWLNRVRDSITASIVAGAGVVVKRAGNQIIIEATGKGGGGGATFRKVTATTKAGLATPTSPHQFARVTAGVEQGREYVPNSTLTGWTCYTALE